MARRIMFYTRSNNLNPNQHKDTTIFSILEKIVKRPPHDQHKHTIHPTAIVDEGAKMGKEALDSVVAVMRRMRQISQLRETTYLGDIKMREIGDEHIPSVTKP